MMNIEEIKNKILNGEVVEVPTDTVYGYICDATNEEATKKIYEMKKRDMHKPLGIFLAKVDDFYNVVDGGKEVLDNSIIDVLNKNWPGALTVICNKNKNFLPMFNKGIETIGVRIPNDKFLLDLLSEIERPLAQTSANISGEKDISSSKIDGRETKASTIIDITENKIKIIRNGDVDIY